MAIEQPGFRVSLPANVDLSAYGSGAHPTPANAFTFVWMQPATNITGEGVGGNSIGPKGTLTYAPIGVLQNNPVQGEAGDVVINGITKCQAGGTIPLGAAITANSTGQAVAATTGQLILGYAYEAAAAGDITSILLLRDGKM